VTIERHKSNAPIHFDPPLPARLMGVDGTWSRDCFLLEVSHTGVQQLQFEGLTDCTVEFFFVLPVCRQPSFRRCKLAWIDGDRIGVSFEKTSCATYVLKLAPRNSEYTFALVDEPESFCRSP
jgi:hypothetical protein